MPKPRLYLTAWRTADGRSKSPWFDTWLFPIINNIKYRYINRWWTTSLSFSDSTCSLSLKSLTWRVSPSTWSLVSLSLLVSINVGFAPNNFPFWFVDKLNNELYDSNYFVLDAYFIHVDRIIDLKTNVNMCALFSKYKYTFYLARENLSNNFFPFFQFFP